MAFDPERARTLFLEAVEYDNPADRTVFLERDVPKSPRCGGISRGS